MNLRALAIVAVLALLGLFSAMNWTAITAASPLTLGFAEVRLPLGLILLGATVVVSGLFTVLVVMQQAAVILESRRHRRELRTQRDLAEKAETSRFSELRAFLAGELRRIEVRIEESGRDLGGRVEHVEQSLQTRFAEADRTTFAYLGEIEDKLDRALPAPNKTLEP